MAARNLLTTMFVRDAISGRKEPGRYPDGDRLYLWVRPPAAPSWLFRFTSPTGRKRDMGFGDATTVGLADARRLADEARALIAEGRDPLDQRDEAAEQARQAEQARKEQARREQATLSSVARAYHERIEGTFKNPKHRQQWISSLEQHTPAELWRRPIGEIEAHELLDFLADLQAKVPETARRVRQRLEAVFDDALLRKLVLGNPVTAVRRHLREPKAKAHFAALDWQEVPALVQRLRVLPGASARALEFGILTAARTGEILGAIWDEIDLEARTWVVPAHRMKRGEVHTVHLSEPAVEVLRRQQGAHKTIVFPSPAKKDAPLSNMALLVLLRRLAVRDRTTVHGLCRTTFSTWGNEHGHRADAVEACLAHREADLVRRAYNRAQFMDERKRLLDAWGAFVSGQGAGAGNVVALAGRRMA